jgi:hypothetical protein
MRSTCNVKPRAKIAIKAGILGREHAPRMTVVKWEEGEEEGKGEKEEKREKEEKGETEVHRGEAEPGHSPAGPILIPSKHDRQEQGMARGRSLKGRCILRGRQQRRQRKR